MGYRSSIAMATYKVAYYDAHGRRPSLVENHGWIRIDGSPKSYRPGQLMNMADALRNDDSTLMSRSNRIISELAEEGVKPKRKIKEYKITMPSHRFRNNDVWDVSDQVKKALSNDDKLTIKPTRWKTYIKKNTIMLFLNQLCEKFNNSPFDMDKAMGHFISTGEFPFGDEVIELLKEEVEGLRANMEEMRDRMKMIIRQKNLYSEKIDIANDEIKKLRAMINQQERDMIELKKNSVVFSLDFMEEEKPKNPFGDSPAWAEDDDIPF